MCKRDRERERETVYRKRKRKIGGERGRETERKIEIDRDI